MINGKYARIYEWQKKNRDKVAGYHRNWLSRNPQKNHEYYLSRKRPLAQSYQSRKRHALQKICGLETPECKYCGCTDLRALEMNHKNLGGNKERKTNQELIKAILNVTRGTSDLEVTCRVCNATHYLAKKFGMKFEVKFIGSPALASFNWNKRLTKHEIKMLA